MNIGYNQSDKEDVIKYETIMRNIEENESEQKELELNDLVDEFRNFAKEIMESKQYQQGNKLFVITLREKIDDRSIMTFTQYAKKDSKAKRDMIASNKMKEKKKDRENKKKEELTEIYKEKFKEIDNILNEKKEQVKRNSEQWFKVNKIFTTEWIEETKEVLDIPKVINTYINHVLIERRYKENEARYIEIINKSKENNDSVREKNVSNKANEVVVVKDDVDVLKLKHENKIQKMMIDDLSKLHEEDIKYIEMLEFEYEDFRDTVEITINSLERSLSKYDVKFNTNSSEWINSLKEKYSKNPPILRKPKENYDDFDFDETDSEGGYLVDD